VHEGLLRDVVSVGGVADAEGAREGGAAVASYQRRDASCSPAKVR
jgi:hypothetical protein